MKRYSMKKSDLYIYLEMLILFLIFRSDGIIKYIVFIVWIAYKILKNRKPIIKQEWIITVPAWFCALYGGLLAIIQGATFETVKEIGFVAVPVVATCVIYNFEGKHKAEKYIDSIFFAIITWFVIFGIRTFTIADLMESSYAFILGAYTVLYFYRKRYKLLILAAICTFLAGKRIVWGAVLISVILIMLLFRRRYETKNYHRKALRSVRIIYILSTSALLLFVYIIRSGFLFSFMISHHVNSMGRGDMWNYFSQYYTFSPLFLGLGLGKVQVILNQIGNTFFGRLHCDILMYYIEFGFLGFILYIYSHFYVIIWLIKSHIIDYKKTILLMTLLIYTLLCFCTDNISIYIHYLFPYYMIFEHIIFSNESLTNRSHDATKTIN